MKKVIIVQVMLLTLSCAETKKAVDNNAVTTQDQQVKKGITAEGIVTEIIQGKDGYTAKLKSDNGEIYHVTISRVNLRNPVQYKTVVIGESLKVSGDLWMNGNIKQITVREIL